MRKLNLLRHKLTIKQRWEMHPHYMLNLPEVVLQGSHVLHTDEFGYILSEKHSDQILNVRHKEEQQRIASMHRRIRKNKKRRDSDVPEGVCVIVSVH